MMDDSIAYMRLPANEPDCRAIGLDGTIVGPDGVVTFLLSREYARELAMDMIKALDDNS